MTVSPSLLLSSKELVASVKSLAGTREGAGLLLPVIVTQMSPPCLWFPGSQTVQCANNLTARESGIQIPPPEAMAAVPHADPYRTRRGTQRARLVARFPSRPHSGGRRSAHARLDAHFRRGASALPCRCQGLRGAGSIPRSDSPFRLRIACCCTKQGNTRRGRADFCPRRRDSRGQRAAGFFLPSHLFTHCGRWCSRDWSRVRSA
jgi:hypothetical protein